MAARSVPNTRSASPSPSPDLAAMMQSMLQKLERQEDKQDALQASLNKGFGDLSSRQTALEADVASVRTEVTGVEVRIGEVEAKVTDLYARVKDGGKNTLTVAATKRLEKMVEDSVREEVAKRTPRYSGDTRGGAKMKELTPPPYDGKGHPEEYLDLFSRLADRNGWGEEEKGVRLLTLLRGDAEKAAAALQGEARVEYHNLRDVLMRRFKRHPDLARQKFHNYVQRRSESVAELALSLQALVVEAYPELNEEARASLTKERFVAALADDEVKYEVQKAVPQSLAEAEHVATIAETARRQVRQERQVRAVQDGGKGEGGGDREPGPVGERLQSLEKAVERLTKELKKPQANVRSQAGVAPHLAATNLGSGYGPPHCFPRATTPAQYSPAAVRYPGNGRLPGPWSRPWQPPRGPPAKP